MLSSAPPLHILYFTGPSKHLKIVVYSLFVLQQPQSLTRFVTSGLQHVTGEQEAVLSHREGKV